MQILVDLGVQKPQAVQQNRGGGHAIGIVVAVDGNPLLGLDGGVDQLGRSRGAGQLGRIAEAIQFGIQELLRELGIRNAAGEQELGDDRRNPRCSL